MNVLENLLVTLMEECSEIAKAASKILRAGPDSTINGTRPTTNLQELQAELDDLQGVLMELRANGLDVVVRNPAAVMKKREKLRHYIGPTLRRTLLNSTNAPHTAADFAEQYQCTPQHRDLYRELRKYINSLPE